MLERCSICSIAFYKQWLCFKRKHVAWNILPESLYVQLSKTYTMSQDRYKLVDFGPENYHNPHFFNDTVLARTSKNKSTIMYARQFNWQAVNTVKSSSV